MNQTAILLPPAHTQSFEIVLARVSELVKEERKVTLLQCIGEVRGCIANLISDPVTCSDCRKLVSSAIVRTNLSEKISFRPLAKKTGQRIPYSVKKNLLLFSKSTIQTFYRYKRIEGNSPRLIDSIFSFITKRLFAHSLYIYEALDDFARNEQPANLEVFNGRIVPAYALVLVAKERSIDFNIIEVSGSKKLLSIFPNRLPQSLRVWKKYLADALSADFTDEDKCSFLEANRFNYSKKTRKGSARPIITWTRAISFRRPKKIRLQDLKSPFVTFYTSSNDELEAFHDEWLTPASRNPASFIKECIPYLTGRFGIVVRLHPNQIGDRTGRTDSLMRELEALKEVTIIRPFDNACSYELLDASSAVITFGSTIGLEASYWGKKSILVGEALWRDFGAQCVLSNAAEVIDKISEDLSPEVKTKSIKVGSFIDMGVGKPSALGFTKVSGGIFTVGGITFLKDKRRSAGYLVNRLLDKLLRIKIIP